MKRSASPLNRCALGLVLVAFGIGVVGAQTNTRTVSLVVAIRQAFARGPDLASSAALVRTAKADWVLREADPASVIQERTKARQTAELETVRFAAKHLEVLGSVLNAHLNLFEAQENIGVLTAQVALDEKLLSVARARFKAGNGIALEAIKAESTLTTSRQGLADEQARLPGLSNRLGSLLGLPLDARLRATAPPVLEEILPDLPSLETGLSQRLPSVLQAMHDLETAELNVRLADNEFTAAVVQRDAKNNLENARRNLEAVRKTALTALRDAHRDARSSLNRVRIVWRELRATEASLAQDDTRFKKGLVSRLQLEGSRMGLRRTRFGYVQGVNACWRSLAALSSSAGVNVFDRWFGWNTSAPTRSMLSKSQPSPTISRLTVFSDRLEAGWQSWSWDTALDFGGLAPMRSGVASIRVKFNTGWAGVSLRHVTPVTTKGFSRLSFTAFGGQGGNSFAVYVQTSDAARAGFRVDLKVPAGRWTRFSLALSSLGSPVRFTRLNFEENTGRAQTAFFLDEIALE